jgi:hypothetical protein
VQEEYCLSCGLNESDSLDGSLIEGSIYTVREACVMNERPYTRVLELDSHQCRESDSSGVVVHPIQDGKECETSQAVFDGRR